mmetsp:Transcript_10464/g.15289  ORF Transcript_10464/g.15289 Transcript_10464/m.15289 type:complete len:242 (-) Transcript_10464:122-847(-)
MNSSGLNLFIASFFAFSVAAAFFSFSFLCFSNSRCSLSFISSAGSASFQSALPPVLSSSRIPRGGRASSRKLSHSSNTPLMSFVRAISRTLERKSIKASNNGANFSSPPSSPAKTGNPISTPELSGIKPNVLKIFVTHFAALRMTRLTGVRSLVVQSLMYKLVALTKSARTEIQVGVSKSSFNASSTPFVALATANCNSLALLSHLCTFMIFPSLMMALTLWKNSTKIFSMDIAWLIVLSP